MKNSQRYLDVMTVRPSRASTTNIAHSGGTDTSKCTLLIEPIVLPNMGHLGVDESTKPSHDCLFYPTGEKKVNMRMEFERTIQSYNNSETINFTTTATTLRTTAQLKSSQGKTNKVHKQNSQLSTRTPLYYTKKKDTTVESLIKESRKNEGDLSSTLNIRT